MKMGVLASLVEPEIAGDLVQHTPGGRPEPKHGLAAGGNLGAAGVDHEVVVDVQADGLHEQFLDLLEAAALKHDFRLAAVRPSP